jgi:pyrroloquinoline quinone (PQQ) biosynthesis protein C
MELKKRLLDHPFYKAWNDGELTVEQLSDYHKAYTEFIESIPMFWAKIVNDFSIESSESDRIVKEETEHILLWEKWSYKLPQIDKYHSMKMILHELSKMSSSQLLGAIHSFEIQQPEIAHTKKDGLKKYYGYTDNDLSYFDEHMHEEHHIKFGEFIADKFAYDQDFKKGFERGSELFYSGLDLFMN